MNILPSFFHRAPKDSKRNLLAYMLRIVRERTVAVGMCMLAFLCAGVLLFDGGVFYTDVIRSREPAAGKKKSINPSEKEVTETIKLIDGRQKEFEDILSAFGGPGNAASSTDAQTGKPRIRQ